MWHCHIKKLKQTKNDWRNAFTRTMTSMQSGSSSAGGGDAEEKQAHLFTLAKGNKCVFTISKQNGWKRKSLLNTRHNNQTQEEKLLLQWMW